MDMQTGEHSSEVGRTAEDMRVSINRLKRGELSQIVCADLEHTPLPEFLVAKRDSRDSDGKHRNHRDTEDISAFHFNSGTASGNFECNAERRVSARDGFSEERSSFQFC